MTSKTIKCGGCLKALEDKHFLRCCVCCQHYDLECAGVSEQRFRNTLTDAHRDAWKCVLCISKLPKTDNSNTPARSSGDFITIKRGASLMSPSEQQEESIVAPAPSNPGEMPLNTGVEMTDTQMLIHEFRLFREEMVATRHQMRQLTDTMATLTARIDVCEDHIGSLSERVAALEGRAGGETGTGSNDRLLLAIEQIKSELNDRDQELLDNDIEIACVPETKGESLPHIIMTLSTKLGVNLTEHDLVSASRVGRLMDMRDDSVPPRPRLIVVRFARRAVRDQLLRQARVRRGATTEGTGLTGPPRRFYLNERLTRVNRQLFRRARQLGQELNWRFVWTRDGKIYARQQQGANFPRHRLRAESDLARVFGSSVV